MKKLHLQFSFPCALSLSGEEMPLSGFQTTDYIPLTGGFSAVEFFLSAKEGIASLAFYDENKQEVSTVHSSDASLFEGTINNSVSIPQSAAYLRVCKAENFEKSAVVLTQPLPTPKTAQKVVAVACIGDSLTEGDYGGIPCVANVQKYNYPYFLQRYFNVLTRNYGRCGNAVSHINDWFDSGEVVLTEANITMIMLGTNQGITLGSDTHLRAYESLLSKIREKEPFTKIVLVTPPRATVNPQKVNFGYANNVENAVKEVTALSKRERLPLIDLYHSGVFTEENEDVVQPRDGLHFGYLGYQKLALYLGEELQKLFPSVFFN